MPSVNSGTLETCPLTSESALTSIGDERGKREREKTNQVPTDSDNAISNVVSDDDDDDDTVERNNKRIRAWLIGTNESTHQALLLLLLQH